MKPPRARFEFHLASRGNGFIREIAELYRSALRKAGHDCELCFDQIPDASPKPGRFPILIAPQEYGPLFLEKTLPNEAIARVAAGCWALGVDQPGSRFFDLAYHLARHCRGVLDINAAAAKEWERRGLNALHLPLPFREMLPAEPPPPWKERPLDLLFIGTDSPRREAFFSRHAEWVEKREAELFFAQHAKTLTPGTVGYLTSGERTRKLFDSRVLLNLHAKQRAYFEWHRILLCVAHGTLCASEPADHMEPLVPGEDLIVADCDELPEAIASILDDPDRAEAMLVSARRKLLDAFGDETPFRDLPERIADWTPVASEPAKVPPPEGSARATNPLRNRLVFPLALGAVEGLEDRQGGFVLKEAADKGRLIVLHLPDFSADLHGAHELTFDFMAEQRCDLQLRIRHQKQAEDPPDDDLLPIGKGLRSSAIQIPVELSGSTYAIFIEVSAPAGTFFRIDHPTLRRHPNTLAIAELESKVKHLTTLVEDLKFTQERRLENMLRQTTCQIIERIAPEKMLRVSDNRPATEKPPQVSVIIPLYNYAGTIAEAMESVAGSEALHGLRDWEIVVVDDASTDRSLSVARDLQGRLDLPVRLVEHPFNLGLARARNTGLQQARGEWVFFLDADNRVLPRGLARLFQAAQDAGDDTAACYGILASFRNNDAEPSKRQPLLSLFQWDPEELVWGPYIDAMALFRRKVLLELGGYDERMQIEAATGWEDYELWLRLADQSCKVRFIPQLIGQYRIHGQSMMASNRHQQDRAVRYLSRKYPRLAERFPDILQPFGAGPPRRIY